MRYLLTLVTQRPVDYGTGTDSTLATSEDDFADPLVVGEHVQHGGSDWRVDEVDATVDPPTARLVRGL